MGLVGYDLTAISITAGIEISVQLYFKQLTTTIKEVCILSWFVCNKVTKKLHFHKF